MGSTTARQGDDAAPAESVGTQLHVPAPVDATSDEPTVIKKPSASGDMNPTIVPAPSHSRSKLLAGEKLGPYELLEFAGGGGMGAVFRARDPMLNRDVAVKVLSRDQATDEETLRRFRNEAQSAARLDHDNIARVYYVGEDQGLYFIVFEFVEGLNVRQLVEKNGPLPLEQAVSYILQVADALAHAATREVVHRDIKPSNILITAQGKAKLVDMGLARLHGIQQPGEDLTASGVTLGTFDYISPEQARDPRMADVRSDIYSLGCTFYFMLTGRPPFPEGTVLQKLLQHNSDDPIDPREYNPNLPEAVTNVLRKMLAKEPQRRYQSPSDLIADLLHLGEQVGMGRGEVRLSTPWETVADGPSIWVRQLPWLVPLTALFLAAGFIEIMDRRAERQLAAGLVSVGTAASPSDNGDAGNAKSRRPNNGDLSPTATAPTPLDTATASSPIPTGTAVPTPVVASTADVGTVVVTPPLAVATPTAPTVAPEPVVPDPRDGLLIVCEEASKPGQYTSLRAACFAARNGDVIELCYDGPRLERPLALNDQKLTIRAGDGFRPTLAFRPAESALPNTPYSMISLLGGRLTMVGLDLDFTVPSAQEFPADRWALFDLQDHESLKLDRCSLTVRNISPDGRPWHQNTAVFALSAPPGNPAAMMNMPGMGDAQAADRNRTELRLDHCSVRGEAVLLEDSQQQPIDFQWNNGAAALAMPLLSVKGGQMPARDVEVRLDLRHLTVACGAAPLDVSNGFDGPFLPMVSIRCADSILSSLSGRPLLDYEGIDARTEFLNSFAWRGDRVFYDGFRAEEFWRLISPTGANQTLTFEDWRAQWGAELEVQSSWGGVRWKRAWSPSAPLHQFDFNDFSLDDAAPAQRAVRGAADGADIGCDFNTIARPAAAAPSSVADDRAS